MTRASRGTWWLFLLVHLASGAGMAQGIADERFQRALRDASATAVIVDVESGRVLLRVGDAERAEAPGSTLKPMVLLTALRAGVVDARTSVHCTGSLKAGGHNLACAHPRDITVVDARQALAESCNSYFAKVAQWMSTETLVSGLRGFGMAAGRVPRTVDERVLMALGLQGVTVSPGQLAEAYRKLAMAMNEGTSGTSLRVVRDGMVQSVQTGMAHAARIDGVEVGGKTGTVDEAGGRSHAWFAGIVFDGQSRARRVVVVYVRNGNGNDAALMARRVLMRLAATQAGGAR